MQGFQRRSDASRAHDPGESVARKPNYGFQKRQRELAKAKKKEAKRLMKEEAKRAQEQESAEGQGGEEEADPAVE